MFDEKTYRKKHHEEHKEHDNARSRDYYLKNRKYLVKKQRAYNSNNKKKLKKLIGSKCFICGFKANKIVFHEIYGKRHLLYASYYFKHPQDFIPLCFRCHLIFHMWFLLYRPKIFGLSQHLSTCMKMSEREKALKRRD